jgi:hypothetical protein
VVNRNGRDKGSRNITSLEKILRSRGYDVLKSILEIHDDTCGQNTLKIVCVKEVNQLGCFLHQVLLYLESRLVLDIIS